MAGDLILLGLRTLVSFCLNNGLGLPFALGLSDRELELSFLLVGDMVTFGDLEADGFF